MADNEGIYGLAKQLIPPQARFYTQTLLGDRTKPFTQEDLTPAELRYIHDAVETSRTRLQDRIEAVKAAKTFAELPKTGYFGEEVERRLGKEKDPTKIFKEIKALNAKHEKNFNQGYGSVQYDDYTKDNRMNNPMRDTLGRFTYQMLPDGTVHVSDKYDFYNPERAPYVNQYEKMTPIEKATEVASRARSPLLTEATTAGGDRDMIKDTLGEIGMAYIGRDGRPVDIKYHPDMFNPQQSATKEVTRKKGGMVTKPLSGGHRLI